MGNREAGHQELQLDSTAQWQQRMAPAGGGG